MEKGLEIITNNPLVYGKYRDKYGVALLEGDCGQLLKTVRDKVHTGWRVLTHPLAGSLKPNETPFRSIVIKTGTGLDYQSLALIENSIRAYEGFSRDYPLPAWNERVLTDFRFVDLCILESALTSL